VIPSRNMLFALAGIASLLVLMVGLGLTYRALIHSESYDQDKRDCMGKDHAWVSYCTDDPENSCRKDQ